MKKNLLLVLLIAISFGIKAQTDSIPNGGFENWQNSGSYDDPISWYTLNFLVDVGFDTTAFRTTDAHTGMYAVKLVSQTSSFQDIPGLLTSGPMVSSMGAVDLNKLKYKFTSRPQKIKFWYKSFPVAGDTCSMFMALLRWNQAFQRNDTIAFAGLRSSQTVSSYTLAELTFNYRLPMPPDSAAILFSSSSNGFAPKPGSTFFIDDLSLVYDFTGINPLSETLHPDIYPNPANDEIFITLDKHYTLTLYDHIGKKVFEAPVQTSHYKLNVSELKSGSYYLGIQADDKAPSFHKVIIH